MLAYTTSTQAQTIRGTVTDAISGETLPGALVKLTGTDKGAVADADGRYIIFRWLSLKSTIEYLGEWEMLYNPNFNCTEFGTFRNMAGSNNFVLSVKTWIEKTGAIGIFSKAGRYGGTYAHRDIAYHFGMWISPKFQLLLVKEYQRLKAEEQKMLGWTAKRELSKINYHIHTDAIKSHLIPEEITSAQASIIYAEEADVLNVAMFGMTAKRK